MAVATRKKTASEKGKHLPLKIKTAKSPSKKGPVKSSARVRKNDTPKKAGQTVSSSGKPVVKKPVVKKPVVKKPVVKKPVVRKPVVKKPVVRKPVVKKPVVKKPVVRKPVVRKPVVRKPAIKKAGNVINAH